MEVVPLSSAARLIVELPLLLFAISAIAVNLLAGRRTNFWWERTSAWCRRVCSPLWIAFALVVIAYTALVAWYTLSPSYFDHVESSVACAMLRFVLGQPIYTGADHAAAMALPYGPLTYVAGAPFLLTGLDPVVASKLSGACFSLLSLIVFYEVVRRLVSVEGAAQGVLFLILVCTTQFHVASWNRPEPLLLFGVSVGLLALTVKSHRWFVLLFACGLTVVANAKISALTVFLPLASMALVHRSLTYLCYAGVLSGAATGLLFLPEQFSAAGYVEVMRIVSRHAISAPLLLYNSVWACFLLLPFLLSWEQTVAWARDSKANTRTAALFVIAVLLTIVSGAKKGSGTYHLLSLCPVAIILYLRSAAAATVRPGASEQAGSSRRFRRRQYLRAWVISLLVLCVVSQARIVRYLVNDLAAPAAAELESMLAELPRGEVSAGYGSIDSYYSTLQRVRVMAHSGVPMLDAPSLMDIRAAGLALSPSTVREYKEGAVRFIIMPAGDAPFTLTNYWYGDGRQDLFGSELRDAFAANYQPISEGRYFTVWQSRQSE